MTEKAIYTFLIVMFSPLGYCVAGVALVVFLMKNIVDDLVKMKG